MDFLTKLKQTLKSKGLNNKDILDIIESVSFSKNDFFENTYGLVWESQPEDKVIELRDKFTSLERLEGITNDTNFLNHILIEGDNLYALAGMQYTHIDKNLNGLVDIIYIDPPYNLCKKDFKYNDTYINPEDQWKHSKWLSFMNKRLRLAHNILKNDGIIMISINEVEQAHLKLLMDEIFGEENLLSNHHIQARYPDKDVANGSEWLPIMEYVFVYAKNKGAFVLNRPIGNYDLDDYKFSINTITSSGVIQIGNKKVEIFKKGDYSITKHEDCGIDLLKEVWGSGSLLKQKSTAAWYYNKYLLNRLHEDGVDTLYKIYDIGDDGLGFRFVKSPRKIGNLRGKVYQGVPLDKKDSIVNNGKATSYKPIINYYDYSADFGNIVNEGGVAFNNGKKPIKMLKDLINLHPNKEAIVLDFFAGSGSTAHAVLDLNKQDNGNRRFIICTNNEVDWDTEVEFLIKKGFIRNKPREKTKDYYIWEQEVNDFVSSEQYKEIIKSSEFQDMGICQSVTLERMKNIMDKNNSTLKDKDKFLNNNLIHYKINLDCPESSIKDITIKRAISKFMHYISLKENCFNIYVNEDDYTIFTNNDTAVLVYKKLLMEDHEIINQSKNLLSLTNKTTLKVYSIIKDNLKINNIEFIPYPQEIIDKIHMVRKETDE